MLSFQTVLPDTLELLKALMQQPLLKEMRLVGGTSLALQYGHRRSVDLDFFGRTTEDIDELTNVMHDCAEEVVRGNFTKRVKMYILDNVKVDINSNKGKKTGVVMCDFAGVDYHFFGYNTNGDKTTPAIVNNNTDLVNNNAISLSE